MLANTCSFRTFPFARSFLYRGPPSVYRCVQEVADPLCSAGMNRTVGPGQSMIRKIPDLLACAVPLPRRRRVVHVVKISNLLGCS